LEFSVLIIKRSSLSFLRLRGRAAGSSFRATHGDAQHCSFAVSKKFFLSAPWSTRKVQEETLTSDSTRTPSAMEGRFIRVRFVWADRL
jgi:hypothetical protein